MTVHFWEVTYADEASDRFRREYFTTERGAVKFLAEIGNVAAGVKVIAFTGSPKKVVLQALRHGAR